MKAVIINKNGGPEVLEIIETEKIKPESGQVSVRMISACVSKPDYLMRSGSYPWTKGKLPLYLGIQGAGIVEEVGENVKDYKPGQPIFVMHPVVAGCYAQYKVAPVECLTPLPEGIDMNLAAVILNYVIAWGMLKDICRNIKGTVYIKGAAGSLGTAIIQSGKVLGYDIIASASTDEKCEYLKAIGADHVFNYKQSAEKDKIRELTKGRGVDLLLDQVVGEQFCDQFELLTDEGTVLIYNTLGGFPGEDNIIKKMTEYYPKCINIKIFSFHYYDDKPEILKALKKEVFEMLKEGRIKPHIGGKFKLDDVVESHKLLDSGNFLGSIVIEI